MAIRPSHLGRILVAVSFLFCLIGCEKGEFSANSFGLTEGAADGAKNKDKDSIEDDQQDPAVDEEKQQEEGGIEIVADVPTLWPPNHKMVKVSLSSPSEAACKIVGVESDEEGIDEDFLILDDMSVELRSERDGNGDGRVYKISVECSMNDEVVSQVVGVTCVHDQGK
ncbi:MAG: hypothetical protein AB7T49_01350 [Oligoflexales bacterium]